MSKLLSTGSLLVSNKADSHYTYRCNYVIFLSVWQLRVKIMLIKLIFSEDMT